MNESSPMFSIGAGPLFFAGHTDGQGRGPIFIGDGEILETG